jgi:beta-lactamase superfamily II metal-dependent hydrolase
VFFFPGDAYGAGQRYVLAHTPAEQLRASVVTAPHHGFNTSPEFAAATRPKFAIASCLPFYKDHKPGDQPAEVTEKLFTPFGTEVFATAWHGNITITSNGESVTAATEHEKQVPPAAK